MSLLLVLNYNPLKNFLSLILRKMYFIKSEYCEINIGDLLIIFGLILEYFMDSLKLIIIN
jgi:hypothetical protein